MKAAPDPLSLALRAVADPTRRRILRLLAPSVPARKSASRQGWTASEIEQRIKLAQPTISHHMKILKNAGLIESTKLGTWVRYHRLENALRALHKELKQEI